MSTDPTEAQAPQPEQPSVAGTATSVPLQDIQGRVMGTPAQRDRLLIAVLGYDTKTAKGAIAARDSVLRALQELGMLS